jgi:hypothetical protein
VKGFELGGAIIELRAFGQREKCFFDGLRDVLELAGWYRVLGLTHRTKDGGATLECLEIGEGAVGVGGAAIAGECLVNARAKHPDSFAEGLVFRFTQWQLVPSNTPNPVPLSARKITPSQLGTHGSRASPKQAGGFFDG